MKNTKLVLLGMLVLAISSSCVNDANEERLSDWKMLDRVTYLSLHDVDFYGDHTGVICGEKGTVLKTTDAGLTWQPLVIDTRDPSLFDFDNLDSLFKSVAVLSDSIFYVASDAMFRTTDGRMTFDRKMSFFDTFFETVNSMSFTDTTSAFIVTESEIFMAFGKDDLWLPANLQNFYDYNVIQMVSDETVYATGVYSNAAAIVKTIDGGDTWQDVASDATEITALHFTDENTGLIADSNSDVYRTTDGGDTWSLFGKTPAPVAEWVFLDALHCVAVGDNKVMESDDGGSTWQITHTEEDVTFSGIAATTDGVLIAISQWGHILRKAAQ